MDPLSLTASLIAVIGLGMKTFNLVKKAVDSYGEAPSEMLALKTELDSINVQLQLLRYIQKSVSENDMLLDLSDAANLESFMLDVIKTFSSIQNSFPNQILAVKFKKRDCIKWVLHDASKMQKWNQRLRRHSSMLKTILQLLEIRHSSLMRDQFKELRQEIGDARNFLTKVPLCLHSRFLWSKRITNIAGLLGPLINFQGSIVSYEKNKAAVYSVSLTVQMLFCLKAICLEFELYRTSLFSAQIFTYSRGLTTKNIISPESEFVLACKQGDHSTVWRLLHTGKANVQDITPSDDTPLRWAIESGSLELVSLLITHGANVKGTFGQFNTNYLQAAFYFRKLSIARLLLSRGADIHHICARGWTPIFHLWQLRDTSDTSDEYLQFVSSASFGDLNLQDSVGWTAMHRAAAYGFANDIIALYERDATLDLRTKVFSWTPIFCAVQYGNVSTFNQLRKYSPDYLKLVDGRRWNLLHVAVNAKHLDMMRLLLTLGSDPHARSMASNRLVPKDLIGVSATPGDIAQLRGGIVITTYLDALRNIGEEVELVTDEKAGLQDLFWLAPEDGSGQTVVS